MNNLAELAFCVALCALPVTFCVLVWRRSSLVDSFWKVLAAVVVISLGGWAIVVGSMGCGERGFPLFCAATFGWAYVWFVGIPVLLFSFLLRCVFGLGWTIRRRLARRELERRRAIWGPVILVLVAGIVFPYLLTIRPAERWHDWGAREYRIQRKDHIVHVEIRENGKVTDVDTHASVVMRYELSALSDDELQLKSGDIGTWRIGIKGGRWRTYVLENGQVRFVDNESVVKGGRAGKLTKVSDGEMSSMKYGGFGMFPLSETKY